MFSCFKDKAFLKKFIKISLPVMIASFVSFLVTFLDNIMVGTVSNAAVSGVYAANQVSFLFNLACFGIFEGAGIFIQQFMGAKDDEHVKQCFRYKLLVGTIFLLVVMPLVYFFGKYLVKAYSKSDSDYVNIYNEGVNYLYIVAISYIPFTLCNMIESSLKEVAKTRYSMTSSIVAIISNTLFNLLFIIGFKWGAPGAAWATVIARCIQAGFLVILCIKKKFVFSQGMFKGFHIDTSLMKKVTRKGWLLFVNEIGYAVGVMLQSLALSQRDGVLSSISIISTVSNIFFILLNGLATGISVMVGADLGANDFEKAKDDNKKLTFLGLYLSTACGLLILALNYPIPFLFKEVTPEQKELASHLLIAYAVFMPFYSLSLTAYFTLRVGGKTVTTFLFDTGTMLVLYVPISWVLAAFTDMDVLWIYTATKIIDVVKATIGIIFVLQNKWVRNITIGATDNNETIELKEDILENE